MGVIAIIFLIIEVVALWRLFEKTGKPGWACLIPFYSNYCYMDIALGNGWFFLLEFLPFVNLAIIIIHSFKLAKAFRMGTAFGFGILFLSPIFVPILAFGDYSYYGVDGEGFGSTGESYQDRGWYR